MTKTLKLPKESAYIVAIVDDGIYPLCVFKTEQKANAFIQEITSIFKENKATEIEVGKRTIDKYDYKSVKIISSDLFEKNKEFPFFQ